MSDRCDILSYDIATGIVTGILAHNIKGQEAVGQIISLNAALLKERAAEIVETGTYARGDFLPEIERIHDFLRHPKKPEPRRKMQYANPHERQAASVCVVCESSNLKTVQHCEKCSREHNERTTYTARREQPPGAHLTNPKQ